MCQNGLALFQARAITPRFDCSARYASNQPPMPDEPEEAASAGPENEAAALAPAAQAPAASEDPKAPSLAARKRPKPKDKQAKLNLE